MRPAKCILLFAIFPSVCAFQSASAQVDSRAVEQVLAAIRPANRVVQPVDDNQRVALDGNTLPQALPRYETGPLDSAERLERMVLVLKASPSQQKALDKLTASQQDPRSPLYHHWLTPELFATHFGVSASDLEQVENWLQRSGLQIDEVTSSHRTLIFSGTAAQVEAALQTSMRSYHIAGRKHIANASDPMVPAALTSVVGGVASLHDFFSSPQHSVVKASPEYGSGSTHYLAPADFATIYNVTSLYRQAYTGDGQTIAIAGRSGISLTDIRKFRSQFALSAKDPLVVLNGRDPGTSAAADLDEATLDVEWSGAVANRATVEYVASASTRVSDGVFLSAQYIVNHNLAPILSVSYGLCETSLGASGNAFFKALWQQAAAQGITVLVSAGDSGAAGCDLASAPKATQGRGVNGICSTPYSVCVGGTGFNEGVNSGQYWAPANTAGASSALGYIPETTWNESGAGGLWATGGGVSNTYAKPVWQTGPGVPADDRRDVPDVSLTAASHDAYLVQVSGALYAFSGTSISSPAFAGLLALVAQKTSSRLGNANPALYRMATAQRVNGGPAVFHDIIAGTNSVPGVPGFPSTAGYDQATGLGSVDASSLVAAWPSTGSTQAFTLAISAKSITLSQAASASLTLSTAVTGGFQAPLALSIAGLPAGIQASFAPATITLPGGGSTLKLTASKTLPTGSWAPIITATGGGISRSVPLTILFNSTASISPPTLTLRAAALGGQLSRGGSMVVEVLVASGGGFNAGVNLAVSGLPAGVTANFTPGILGAAGLSTKTLTIVASQTAALGVSNFTVWASGGGLMASCQVAANVIAAAGLRQPVSRAALVR